MLLPYWEVVRGQQTRLLPLLRATVHGPAGAIEVFALADSGAEQNVFGDDLAERVGISLDDGEPVTIIGVGSQEMPGLRVNAELQLGTHRWTAPIIFASAIRRQALLGQAGFFAFFTVTFRYQRRQIEIRQAR